MGQQSNTQLTRPFPPHVEVGWLTTLLILSAKYARLSIARLIIFLNSLGSLFYVTFTVV